MGSCLNSHAETSNNLGYSLLKNGAIATIGGTRVTIYVSPQSSFEGKSSDQGFLYQFGKYLALDKATAIGALDKIRSTTVPEGGQFQNYMAYVLYGDPSIGLFTYGGTTHIESSSRESKSRPSLVKYISNGKFVFNETLSPTRITLFSVTGRELFNQTVSAGASSINLPVAEGNYVLRLEGNGVSQTIPVNLVR